MRRATGNFEEQVTYHTVTVKQGTGSRGEREMEIQYANMQLIGNGSFGTVYKATLCESDETVAIKKIIVDHRFKNRELSIMHEMDHPNLTRLLYYYYTHQTDNVLHLIMEFVPKDLHSILRYCSHNNQQIPSNTIKLYTFQMLRGVGFLHLHNIVHRDIKPKNLLVDDSRGLLKICDFGSAKKLVKNEPNVSYVCSRYYRAPELHFGANTYGTSIDTWSCGTVVAELFNNEAIFRAETSIDVLVLQIKAFGTPAKEEMLNWNYRYVNIPLEQIQGVGIQQFIKRKLSLPTVQLLNGLMSMNPQERVKPYNALTLPYFDVLRDADFLSSNVHTLPPLFDWLEKEYLANERVIKSIFPRSNFEN